MKGLKIPFLERPSQNQSQTEIKMSQEEKKLVDIEVQELLRKGIITPARGSKDQFVSNIFLRPNKDGRFRPITNLKKLNQFIPYSHFKMEGLKQLKDLQRQNDLMVKIDLEDAYFSIPLHPETQVCKVSMERETIPIHMYLVWSVTCSQDLHQTFKNSYINSTGNKHSIDNLPRHFNYREESGRNLNESRHSNISTPTPRFCKKPTEIQIGTKHKT